MLNIVFVTFLFGIGLPILFPIGLISLALLYYTEKILLFYYYREPPSYDSSLNSTAINIMLFAPIMMFSVGYWMMSNKQMFSNVTVLNEQANPVAQRTGHVIFHDLTDGPAFLLFVMTVVCLILRVFKERIAKWVRESKFAPIRFDEKYDEHLPNYFEALEFDDVLYLMHVEKHMRKNFGIKTLMDSTLRKLVNAGYSTRKIFGIGVYDILANHRYCERFQYDYHEQICNRNFNENNTKVKIWLSLGFMKNKDALVNTQFGRAMSYNFTFAEKDNINFEGIIDETVEDGLDYKINEIVATIDKVEDIIHKEVNLSRSRISETEHKDNQDDEEVQLKEI